MCIQCMLHAYLSSPMRTHVHSWYDGLMLFWSLNFKVIFSHCVCQQLCQNWTWANVNRVNLMRLLCDDSMGVGRTGVFIALSIALERMRFEGVVDMFQTIRLLRTQRPAMVQSEVCLTVWINLVLVSDLRCFGLTLLGISFHCLMNSDNISSYFTNEYTVMGWLSLVQWGRAGWIHPSFSSLYQM